MEGGIKNTASQGTKCVDLKTMIRVNVWEKSALKIVTLFLMSGTIV